jgi:hypothetical protein
VKEEQFIKLWEKAESKRQPRKIFLDPQNYVVADVYIITDDDVVKLYRYALEVAVLHISDIHYVTNYGSLEYKFIK